MANVTTAPQMISRTLKVNVYDNQNPLSKKIKIFVALGESSRYSTQDIEKDTTNEVQSNMSQGMLSFKYKQEKTLRSPISLADLPVYLDLVKIIALDSAIAPLALV